MLACAAADLKMLLVLLLGEAPEKDVEDTAAACGLLLEEGDKDDGARFDIDLSSQKSKIFHFKLHYLYDCRLHEIILHPFDLVLVDKCSICHLLKHKH